MRLFTNQVKRKFEFPVTPLEAQSKDFGTASQMLLTRVKLPLRHRPIMPLSSIRGLAKICNSHLFCGFAVVLVQFIFTDG